MSPAPRYLSAAFLLFSGGHYLFWVTARLWPDDQLIRWLLLVDCLINVVAQYCVTGTDENCNINQIMMEECVRTFKLFFFLMTLVGCFYF